MADTLQGLFADPRLLQQAQDIQLAQMTPNQRLFMMGRQTGRDIGQGLGGFFGVDVQDPAMAKASKLRELGAKYGTTTAEGLRKIAADLQQTDPGMAMQVSAKADELEKSSTELSLSKAKVAKEARAASMEEQLRSELAALGPEATEEDVLKVVTKYGTPDKVLAALQSSQTRKASAEQQLQATRERIQAQIQMAQDRNATQQQIAQMQIEGRQQLAQLAAALKGNAPKSLPAGLQKAEDEDLMKVDAATAQSEALSPVISSLTADPKTGKSLLDLTPTKIAGYVYQNSTGKSSPESRAYAQLKEAVGTAVNIKTSAEKGVQTDKDVLRFADALIAASGRLDTKATLDALTRFNDAVVKDQERLQKRINSRRKSQGVEEYYPSLGQPEKTPQKTEAAPKKATKRYNEATGQFETL